MIKYILKRLLYIIPMLLCISIVSFFIIDLAPGDAADMYADPELTSDPQYIENVRKQLGLNKPVVVRYLLWLKEVLKGNFGYSLLSRQPVMKEIKDRIGITIIIATCSIILQYVIGLGLGIFCAKRQYKISDYITSILGLIGLSVPSFWLALVLIIIFTTKLGLLPSSGLYTVGLQGSSFVLLLDRAKHLILPIIVMSVGGIGSKLRYQRSSFLEVMNQDYIRTAKSKGVNEMRLTWIHAFKNSSLPIITMVAGLLPSLIGGSFVVESIFGIPGLGRYGTNAALHRDYPVIMGILMVTSFLVMIGILISDLLYVLFDPRIKLQGGN